MSLADAVRLYVERVNQGQPTSIVDLAETLNLPPDELSKFFKYPPVVTRLKEEYDLPPPPLKLSRKSLTQEQRRWIQVCTNPYTAKPVSMLAVEFGINLTTHRRWMKQPAFREEYNRALRDDLTVAQGEMARKQAYRALQGDTKAVEMFHRLAGKPLAALEQSADSTALPLTEILTRLQAGMDSEELARVASILLNPTPRQLPVGEEDNG